jgi:thiaminase/transcriptional activator TenA
VTRLSERLTARGGPAIDEQLRHPTVAGIARGDLDPEVFRSWLEQDYLFLLDYVRVFAKLASKAPDAHLGDFVDLAYSTWHDELDLHRTMSAGFGADLDGAVKGPACAAYTAFLLDASDDYGRGLAALLPCMWGYSELGSRLAASASLEHRYSPWIETYANEGFAALARRCAEMLDEAHAAGLVDETSATTAFDTSLAHELAFWDVP